MTMKLQFVIEAVDKATSKLGAINKAVDATVDRVTLPARKLRASINNMVAESGYDKVSSAWKGLKEQVTKLPMVAAISLGGAFAVMHQTIEEIDRTVDVSKKLNIPIQQFQRLGFAASVNGSSVEDMGTSLQFLSQNMVEAIGGSKEAAVWFARVGIPIAQLKKMNVVQVFEAIADKFEKVGDAGQNAEKKIALTRALMGRGGADQIQMLNQGSKSLKQYYDEADKFGTLNEKQAAEFKETADNFKRFEASLKGLLATVTAAALPGMDKMLEKVSNMNVESRKELGDKIGKMLSAIIEKMPKVLQSLGQISKGVVMLVTVMDWLAQKFGGWDVLIVGFSSVMVAKGAWAVYEVVKAVGILSGAMLVTPFGWFLLAVAAIATAAYQLYRNFDLVVQKLHQLKDAMPKWMTDRDNWLVLKLLPDIQLPAGPSAAAAAASAVPGNAAKTAAAAGASPFRPELGGTLRIEFDANGQPRVRELQKNPGSALNFDVYTGPSLAFP